MTLTPLAHLAILFPEPSSVHPSDDFFPLCILSSVFRFLVHVCTHDDRRHAPDTCFKSTFSRLTVGKIDGILAATILEHCNLSCTNYHRRVSEGLRSEDLLEGLHLACFVLFLLCAVVVRNCPLLDRDTATEL